MSDFPRHPLAQTKQETVRPAPEAEEEEEDDGQTRFSNTQKRLCDFCNESVALLYCRADSAKLCLSCDREVHSTNQLFQKHTRWQLCDACGDSPAAIHCSTHGSVLCQNCDWDRHNRSVSTLHDRRPLEGFSGCPSVTELLGIVGLESGCGGGGGYKGLFGCDKIVGGGGGGGVCESGDVVGDGFSDLFGWETPSVVSLDDLIGATNSGHNFQAIGVPPPPKSHNAAVGLHKEEMLHQLRELAKLEPDFNDEMGATEPLMGFKSQAPKEYQQLGNMYSDFDNGAVPATIPSYEVSAFQWGNDNPELANEDLSSTFLGSCFEENCLVPDEDLDIGGNVSHTIGDHGEQSHHHTGTEALQIIPLTSQERDSAISRYKQKKKTRRYDKHVRYESRKVRAESRTRINGRFAKTDR